LSGVSVTVPGSRQAVVTDAQGRFSLPLKDNQTILQGKKIEVLCSYRNTKCID